VSGPGFSPGGRTIEIVADDDSVNAKTVDNIHKYKL
jgi:hypothetical protein